ncbi:hypothetical protein V1477_009057 [Vespula maculifrons]|uniref:Uncharacterized protein n=1 Tax=Vespula maculifrons TaxID=7453 RepID=A0ABD2CH50_VESMC
MKGKYCSWDGQSRVFGVDMVRFYSARLGSVRQSSRWFVCRHAGSHGRLRILQHLWDVKSFAMTNTFDVYDSRARNTLELLARNKGVAYVEGNLFDDVLAKNYALLNGIKRNFIFVTSVAPNRIIVDPDIVKEQEKKIRKKEGISELILSLREATVRLLLPSSPYDRFKRRNAMNERIVKNNDIGYIGYRESEYGIVVEYGGKYFNEATARIVHITETSTFSVNEKAGPYDRYKDSSISYASSVHHLNDFSVREMFSPFPTLTFIKRVSTTTAATLTRIRTILDRRETNVPMCMNIGRNVCGQILGPPCTPFR